MIEPRSTGRERLQPALGLAALVLISLLFWQVVSAVHTQPDELVCLALPPLLVASFRYPVLGQILGWAGVLLQIATMLLGP